MLAAAERAGFLAAGHGLDAEHVFEYVSAPYVPYLEDEFTFTRRFVGETLAKVLDLNGPYRDVISHAQHAGVVRDPRPGGVGHERAARQAATPADRGGRSWPSTARTPPPATELGRIEAEWRGGTRPLEPRVGGLRSPLEPALAMR